MCADLIVGFLLGCTAGPRETNSVCRPGGEEVTRVSEQGACCDLAALSIAGHSHGRRCMLRPHQGDSSVDLARQFELSQRALSQLP
jgi:hypothetical protein